MSTKKIKIPKELLILVMTLLVFLITSNIFFLKDLPIFPDEAIYYDMAHNLITTGKLLPNIFPTNNKALIDSGLGVSPLYFYFLGKWTQIFGSSIESVRTMSLLLGLVSLSVFSFVLKILFKKPLLISLGVLMLSINIYFSRATRLGRPDILAFLFLQLCLLSYLLGLKKKEIKYFLISGIFSALAVITHPMGIINVVILISSILLTKDISLKYLQSKITPLFLILIPFFVAVFWFVFVFNNYSSFLESVRFHMINTSNQEPFVFILFRSNPFYSILILSELVVFITFLISLKKNFSQTNMFILFGTVASIIITTAGKENFYILYIQPFIILCLLSIFDNFKKKTTFFKIAAFVSILIIANNLNIQYLNNDNLATKDLNKLDYHKFSSQITNELPKNTKLTILLVSVPDPYFDLKNNPNYKFIEVALDIEANDYQNILNSGDYLLTTWVPNNHLLEYIYKNSAGIKTIGQEDGYHVSLVQFKPKKDRK